MMLVMKNIFDARTRKKRLKTILPTVPIREKIGLKLGNCFF